MVLMMVLPFLWANFCKSLQIVLAINESRPEVGSSSKITLGSVISSTPIAVLLRSPPEMVFFKILPTIVFEHFSIPNSLIKFSTLLSYSSSEIFNLSLAANVKASLTVK